MLSSRPTKPIRVLFATDGSEHARAAASLLNDLAFPPGSSIVVLGVLMPRDASGYALLEKVLEKTKASLKENGATVSAELLTGYPAAVVVERAEAHQADLIVLGAKGLRHTLGILLGGVAQQVVEYGQSPVLVVRAPYAGLQRVMLVTDGSSHSQNLIEFLAGSGNRAAFPLCEGADIRVVHVTAPLGHYYQYLHETYLGPGSFIPLAEIAQQQEEDERRGKEILAQAVDPLTQAGLNASPVMLSGDAATEILTYAKENQIDLIMAGSRGFSPAKSWLLGSVSHKLVHYANCSVLVTK